MSREAIFRISYDDNLDAAVDDALRAARKLIPYLCWEILEESGRGERWCDYRVWLEHRGSNP